MALSPSLSLSSGVSVPTSKDKVKVSSPKWAFSCHLKPNSCCKPPKLSKKPFFDIGIGIGVVAASVMALTPLDADATRIEYYATVGEPLCELKYAKSGLGYCDILEGSGEEVPFGELINVVLTHFQSQLNYVLTLILVIIVLCYRFTILQDLLMG